MYTQLEPIFDCYLCDLNIKIGTKENRSLKNSLAPAKNELLDLVTIIKCFHKTAKKEDKALTFLAKNFK